MVGFPFLRAVWICGYELRADWWGAVGVLVSDRASRVRKVSCEFVAGPIADRLADGDAGQHCRPVRIVCRRLADGRSDCVHAGCSLIAGDRRVVRHAGSQLDGKRDAAQHEEFSYLKCFAAFDCGDLSIDHGS